MTAEALRPKTFFREKKKLSGGNVSDPRKTDRTSLDVMAVKKNRTQFQRDTSVFMVFIFPCA